MSWRENPRLEAKCLAPWNTRGADKKEQSQKRQIESNQGEDMEVSVT